MQKGELDIKKIKKITFASRGKVSKYEEELHKILKLLGHPEALITDLSSIGDFAPKKSTIKKIEKLIGDIVLETDLLVDIASKFRRRPNLNAKIKTF
jgi:hypothetical protein